MKQAPDFSAAQKAVQDAYDSGYADGQADQKAIDTEALQGAVSGDQEKADIAAATAELNQKLKDMQDQVHAAHQLDVDVKGKLLGAISGINQQLKAILDAAIPDEEAPASVVNATPAEATPTAPGA